MSDAKSSIGMDTLSDAEKWKRQVGPLFGKLPREVVERIFEYAVVFEGPKKDKITATASISAIDTVSAGEQPSLEPYVSGKVKLLQKAIKPVQVCPTSNKFVHGSCRTERSASGVYRNISTEKQPLAVVALMATCKAFYTVLNESSIFYKMNRFHFDSPREMLCYLSSITPSRLNDIREVSFLLQGYSYDARVDLIPACVLLSTCNNLENVSMLLSGHCQAVLSDENFSKTEKNFKNSVSQIRCKKFNVFLNLKEFVDKQSKLPADASSEQKRAELRAFEATLRAKYYAPSSGPPAKVNTQDLHQARECSKVNIHGDGRLIGVSKPALVSSRTRGALAKMSKINSDGIFEEKEPKFNIEGNLVWDVKYCKDHREVSDPETNLKILEVLVVWGKPPASRIDGVSGSSWESLEVLLTNDSTTWRLINYFTPRDLDLCKTRDIAKVLYDAEVAYKALDGHSRTYAFIKELCARVKNWEEYLTTREKYLAAQEAKKEAEDAAAEDNVKDTNVKGSRGKKVVNGKATKSIIGQKRKRNA